MLAVIQKCVRKVCCSCQNVYSQIEVPQARFDELLEDPDVDWSQEGDVEIITRTGCCPECLKEGETA